VRSFQEGSAAVIVGFLHVLILLILLVAVTARLRARPRICSADWCIALGVGGVSVSMLVRIRHQAFLGALSCTWCGMRGCQREGRGYGLLQKERQVIREDIGCTTTVDCSSYCV
jgi:hypothetical protein